MKRRNDEDKRQQEQRVGQIFRDEYKSVTGIKLQGNEDGPQPPDRIFYYKDSRIGCEIFEVEQFYSARGLFNKLENKIFAEFVNRGCQQRYQGLRIDITTNLIQTDTGREIAKRWNELKIKGNNLANCAKGVVDLVCEHIVSVDSIPINGLRIDIDQKLHPALYALTTEIYISKGSPIVVIGGNYLVPSDDESIYKLINDMKKKIKKKQDHNTEWHYFSHSVLIAHELPRKQTYLARMIEWPKNLKIAADKVKLLESFDELWFVSPVSIVTTTDIVGSKAQFICGSHIKSPN